MLLSGLEPVTSDVSLAGALPTELLSQMEKIRTVAVGIF